MGSIATGLGTAGMGKTAGTGLLNSVMGSVSSVLNPISAIAGSIAPIASLFKRSAEGQKKIDATKNQVNLENWMKGIEDRVKAGTMDIDTASAAIKDMMGTVSPDNAANRMGAQLLANFSTIRTQQANAGYQPGEAALTGGAESQKLRGQTLMRNMMMGTQSGNSFAAATPAGQLIKPRTDPGQIYQRYSRMNASPVPTTGNLGDKIMQALNQYGKVQK